ncbi:hypothetical protein V6Z11_D07G196800 [Gossypium hirsutum]
MFMQKIILNFFHYAITPLFHSTKHNITITPLFHYIQPNSELAITPLIQYTFNPIQRTKPTLNIIYYNYLYPKIVLPLPATLPGLVFPPLFSPLIALVDANEIPFKSSTLATSFYNIIILHFFSPTFAGLLPLEFDGHTPFSFVQLFPDASGGAYFIPLLTGGFWFSFLKVAEKLDTD